MYSATSPSSVFSILHLTILALMTESSVTSVAVMIGVLIYSVAFMISFILGTPKVTFILATPAKWKVLSVI